MSTLRQVKKDATAPAAPAEDVEAPPVTSPPKAPATAFAAASGSDSAPAGAGNNPVFLAKVIMKKVFTLLVESDEEDLTRPGGIVTLLKDIILGVILGVLTISILIFLDHRDVVHFQSAHNFRNAGELASSCNIIVLPYSCNRINNTHIMCSEQPSRCSTTRRPSPPSRRAPK